MRILLIRHGEPDYSTDSLTEKGKREAELLSARLAAYSIRDFYVSPLGRAKLTADYTLQKLGRSAVTLPWLAEFRGRYPDPETGKMRICWDFPPREWTRDPLLSDPVHWAESAVFRGGNVSSVWEETVQGADRLLADYGFFRDGPVWHCRENTHDTIALFCHFAISMAFIAYLVGLSPVLMMQHFICFPSSVTELVTEERTRGEAFFRISKLGDLSHLESAGVTRSMAGMFPECYTGIDSTDQFLNGSVPLIP